MSLVRFGPGASAATNTVLPSVATACGVGPYGAPRWTVAHRSAPERASKATVANPFAPPCGPALWPMANTWRPFGLTANESPAAPLFPGPAYRATQASFPDDVA